MGMVVLVKKKAILVAIRPVRIVLVIALILCRRGNISSGKAVMMVVLALVK